MKNSGSSGAGFGNSITIAPKITINGNTDSNTITKIADELDLFARKVETVFERGIVDTSRVAGAFA